MTTTGKNLGKYLREFDQVFDAEDMQIPGRFRWRLSGRRLGFQTENDRRPGQSWTSQKLSPAQSGLSLARHGGPPLDDERGRQFRLKAACHVTLRLGVIHAMGDDTTLPSRGL